MESETNAILICENQTDVSIPTKRCLPLRVHLAEETPDKSSGVIGSIMILVDQMAEPRIPRPPLPACR
jgi:hypothetical protein